MIIPTPGLWFLAEGTIHHVIAIRLDEDNDVYDYLCLIPEGGLSWWHRDGGPDLNNCYDWGLYLPGGED